MTYHELLERFKNDQLDKEQKKQVEADIEKHEAISDYLLEAADIPELEELSLTEPTDDATLTKEAEQSEQFAKEVKAYITRAFAKAGIIVGACVLAIVLFVIFALPKVVDWFYYNPAKIVGTSSYGEETNQISLDMAVYSELFLPGHFFCKVICEPEGYGCYNIYIPDACAGKVVRNKLTLYEPNLTKPVYPEWFYIDVSKMKRYTESGHTDSLTKEKTTLLSYLKDRLDDDKIYIAYISLGSIMSYSEVNSLYDEPGIIPSRYILCWKNGQGKFENNFHTPIAFSDASGLFSSDLNYSTLDSITFESEKYPCLTQDSLEYNLSNSSVEQHVISMLRYVNDHQTFSLLNSANNHLPKDYYEQVAQQIENQGLYVYCFMAEADKKTLLQLAQNENVADIFVEDSRSAIYS